VTRPFRFAVTPPPLRQPIEAWQDELRRIEDLGIDAVVLADHFTGDWEIEPMVGLTAAALSTTRLDLQTGVLGNDYRHPVLTHRMAALLDVVSNGRLVLGLGAGWLRSDYEAGGMTLDPPRVRIDRLEESIAIIKGLFGSQPFSYDGVHYQIRNLLGRPAPVQSPRPRIFLGGGGPRMLRLAGREADIVGVNATQKTGALGREPIVDLFRESVERKVGWVREGILAAGRGADSVELEMNLWLARITASASEARDHLERVARRYEVDPDALGNSPSVMVGTVEHCAELLLERRESLGFNHFQLDAGAPPRDVMAFAPLIRQLGAQ
jgi:probable F420-dependent oxidoreductase